MSRLRAALGRMKSRVAGFHKADNAVAAVEFALILPFLITLFFGTIEAGSLLTVDRRVSTITGTIGDLVAQSDGTITAATLASYFQAARNIIIPYSTANLKQVVNLVSVSSTGVTQVVWSCAYNGGTVRAVNSTYPLAASTQMNQVARTVGYLVAAETSYSYKPVFGVVFKTVINLHRENFYIPRFGARIDLVGTC